MPRAGKYPDAGRDFLIVTVNEPDAPLGIDPHERLHVIRVAPEPNYSYEPVGLIDLPPGHRGYGSDERIELTVSVDDYNTDVDAKQREHGKLDTVDPIGSRIQWGAWEQAV